MECELQYWIWNILVPLITWWLTVYFACKSYLLEKNNNFHWEWYVQKMSTIDWERNYIMISFLNKWNVEWYITELLVEVSYHSLKDRVLKVFWKNNKYIFLPHRKGLLSQRVVNQDRLPWHVEPRKTRAMYFDNKTFIEEMNNIRWEFWVNIKNFVFRDSTYRLYKYRIRKKEFPEFFEK